MWTAFLRADDQSVYLGTREKHGRFNLAFEVAFHFLHNFHGSFFTLGFTLDAFLDVYRSSAPLPQTNASLPIFFALVSSYVPYPRYGDGLSCNFIAIYG